MDLWALLSITAPGLFPHADRFAEYYRRPIERHGGRRPARSAAAADPAPDVAPYQGGRGRRAAAQVRTGGRRSSCIRGIVGSTRPICSGNARRCWA